MPNWDLAYTSLDELYNAIKQNINAKGFDNKSVMWMVKAWSKIGVYIRGSHKPFAMHMIRLKPPAALTGPSKRSEILKRNVGDLYDAIKNHGKLPNDDMWTRAQQAMVDFTQDYWQKTVGSTHPATKEADFAGQLRAWFGKSDTEVLETEIFQMDRHA